MDLKNREAIKIMVDTFYDKIKVDEKLGPVFHQVIADNWDMHLEKMYNFWESLLFQQPVYNGRPFPKHADLPIQPAHFDRWIKLFNQNLDEQFEGPIADQAKKIAGNIAQVFMSKMFGQNPELKIV